MHKIIISLLLAMLTYSIAQANITMNKDGSRGIADVFSAKTVGEGRLFFGISPSFTFDKIGVTKYDGQINELSFNSFLKDGELIERNNSTFTYFAPVFLGYGWNNHSTTTLGLYTFHDNINNYDDLSNGGATELYLMQKFTLPMADTVFNVGLVGQVFFSSISSKDGVVARWSEAHYRSTNDDPYKSLSARHSESWALKVLVPMTVDISAKNPDVLLQFHLNVGALFADPNDFLDTKILGNIGVEFSPHETFGLYAILNGGMRWSNMARGYADLFKDDMSVDFGLAIKGNKASFTAGAKKAISKSPTEEKYFDEGKNDKAWNSSLNSALYHRQGNSGDRYLINSPVPPEWTVNAQLNFFLYIVKQDADGDGIVDSEDLCPNEPEDFDGFEDSDGCPDNDNDGDGITDLQDRCPNEPEDVDGFQDNDGCPDNDNDADGVLDINDKCPGTDADFINTREDIDGFEDFDGCPDADNDADGIPDVVDKCPGADSTVLAGVNTKEDMNGVEDTDGCPDNDKDSDGDGVPDAIDKCPTQAEDKDGFQDGDGCPDADNDGDGVLDIHDKCPGTDSTAVGGVNTKENYNGVEDTDGCPDGEADRDGDGIPDNLDKCPTQPEDNDGFEDHDGCPDLDNDVDGIKDIADACPGTDSTVAAGIDTKETFNGYEDVDGCPDTPKLSKKPMKLNVYFESGSARLKRNSYSAIDDLISNMKSDKDANIIIEGYTDSKGSYQSNQRLSKRRADAVRTYLIKNGGISPNRVKSVGKGEDNPVADNATPEGRELNRRIEVRRQ